MKEGLQFTAKGDKSILVITHINTRTVYYSWIEDGNIMSAPVPRKTAKGMFESGGWKILKKKKTFFVK